MYDSTTSALIRSAPALEGLDLSRLPEFLTESFATLVSERLRLSESSAAFDTETVRRIANTYETYAALLPDAANRKAAAFVAASAHHLLFLSRFQVQRPVAELARDFVTPDVSALLLFLCAGYPADAAQTARLMSIGEEGVPAQALGRALKALGAGRFRELLTIDIPEEAPSDDMFVDATDALWREIHEGLRQLAERILTTDTNAPRPDPMATFAGVQRASVQKIDLPQNDAKAVLLITDSKRPVPPAPGYSVLAGPHHLASLLIQGGNALLERAVARVPAPPGVPADRWSAFLGSTAERRPLLWDNHLEILGKGYLVPGTSSVLALPTGAGKSTLAELKIATALFRDRQVIFIVPTHALVSQVRADLKHAFPEADVRESLVPDGAYSEVDPSVLPDIAVMTPERTLALLATVPDSFANIGLIVMDECHLLHPSDGVTDRRSLDAMLCFLRATEIAPMADVLLMSAMMGNEVAISEWISELLGRTCIPLRVDWKPTRQARGCVVFDRAEVEQLRANLKAAKAIAPPGRGKSKEPRPSQALKRKMKATARGLFCLKQLWSTKDTEDYKLLPLLDDPVPLAVNKWWKLTANRNHVAATIAARFAARGMKTLVFAQNKKHAMSLAEEIGTLVPGAVELNQDERMWCDLAISEMGGEEHVLGLAGGQAAVHHGLLLSPERYLVESIFRREDGIKALAGTPTLAQGMNLPAQVVVLAGDDRFDAEASQAEMLEAHELLNAVGRAGRAGYSAEGIVLLVPGSIIELNQKENQIAERWVTLQETIFSKADQCLDIEDPVGVILDVIQGDATARSPADGAAIDYFVTRLPADGSLGERLLNRSLAAFHARRRGVASVFAEKSKAALALRAAKSASTADPTTPTWKDEIATATGLPPWLIADVSEGIDDLIARPPADLLSYVGWFFDWLRARPRDAAALLRGDIFRGALPTWHGAGEGPSTIEVDLVQSLTRMWMDGTPLVEIQRKIDPKREPRECIEAREFALQCIPDLSYAVGLFAQVYRRRAELDDSLRVPLVVAVGAACVRDGVDSPEKLVLRQSGGPKSRQEIQRAHAVMVEFIPESQPWETFAETRARVRIGRMRQDLRS